MSLHRGINTTSIAGQGLEDLPGLIIAIAFVFIFAGIFMPRNASNWILVLFIVVEGVASAAYIVSQKRERKATQETQQMLHRLNEAEDQHADPTTRSANQRRE